MKLLDRKGKLIWITPGHIALRWREYPLTGVVLSWARRPHRPLPWHVMLTGDWRDRMNGWMFFRGRGWTEVMPTERTMRRARRRAEKGKKR